MFPSATAETLLLSVYRAGTLCSLLQQPKALGETRDPAGTEVETGAGINCGVGKWVKVSV